MADKKNEPKIEYEREYTVPLRKGWLKVPSYKRANKAVKTLKEFLVRHMKIYDRDLRKIKVDVDLNNELRFRGMTKPPARIKVKAKKFDDGMVSVGLVELPKHIEFRDKRVEKKDSKKKAPEIKAADAGKASKDASGPVKKDDASKEEDENTEKSIEGTQDKSSGIDKGSSEDVVDNKKDNDKKEVKK